MNKQNKQTKSNTAPAVPEVPTPELSAQPSEVPAPVETQQVAHLTEEVAHWKDLALRSQAEMDNLRKRTKIDMENAVRYANKDFAKDLLTVADCLDSALKCALEDQAHGRDAFLKNLIQGIDMTRKQFADALKKHGIEKMETIGRIFDPELHKVIQEVDDPSRPTGTIVQELQAGYTISGARVLREAMVIVSK